ncbi:MAG: ADP-glyceromanno-heptose 6-epimerase [Bacteroidia bacterium]|nr:ADP-glyceromanno-heptose 6-epimerase [Bacteroidia bacterium]
MIIVTGAAGFIGSNVVAMLNSKGFKDIVIVDDFSRADKSGNYKNKIFSHQVERDVFFEWLDHNHRFVQFIVHMGARTDTTESDRKVFDRLNLGYSQDIWKACVRYGLPLIYASSAATYGGGEHGYNDDHSIIGSLKPLNPYGESKNEFDKWALEQSEQPFFWAGLKFFNVYGPNEYHKGRMASVIFHAFKQINQTGEMKLFRSHHPGYRDGEQLRDFIYVPDVVNVIFFFLNNRKQSGIFNLGTGTARTFADLTAITFRAMGIKENISFIDTPADIRDKYQYFTEANMTKLRAAGYQEPFTRLEDGITSYVREYLVPGKYA